MKYLCVMNVTAYCNRICMAFREAINLSHHLWVPTSLCSRNDGLLASQYCNNGTASLFISTRFLERSERKQRFFSVPVFTSFTAAHNLTRKVSPAHHLYSLSLAATQSAMLAE